VNLPPSLVERHSEQIEERDGHKGRVCVEDVVGVDEDVGREGGDRDEDGGARPEEPDKGVEVGGLFEGDDLRVANAHNLDDG
jgi:hypothetical protein